MGGGASITHRVEVFDSLSPPALGVVESAEQIDRPRGPRKKLTVSTLPSNNVDVVDCQQNLEPPQLMDYLRELYEYNLSLTGQSSLQLKTFWHMIETLFIHVLSDSDLTYFENYLNPREDEPVSWEDASQYLQVQLKILKRRNRDYWLGLKTIGATPGKYFWINIRNDTSHWMSEKEAYQYERCLARHPIDRPVKWLVPSSCRPECRVDESKASLSMIPSPVHRTTWKEAIADPASRSSPGTMHRFASFH